MFEETFYNLLNSIMEKSDEELEQLMNEGYDNFLNSLLYNQELINETRRQMRGEGLITDQVLEKKEDLLADMRALVKPMHLSQVKQDTYLKILDIVNQIMDQVLEDYNRDTINVMVELCHPNAKMPTYAHSEDAGFDFYLPEDFTIKAHEYGKLAATGIKMVIPEGYELQIRPRSGNSIKTTLRIANTPGTIDCGFRGEIAIICDNIGDTDLTFKAGDRIAQGILSAVPKGKFVQIEDINKIVGTNRNGGFGSTGQ